MAVSARIVFRSIASRVRHERVTEPFEVPPKGRRRDVPTREERLFQIMERHPEISARVVL